MTIVAGISILLALVGAIIFIIGLVSKADGLLKCGILFMLPLLGLAVLGLITISILLISGVTPRF